MTTIYRFCEQCNHRTVIERPKIVCLCGSTKFVDEFRAANMRETLDGKIVLSIGCDMKSDEALGLPPETKERLDELHLRKIDMCDEILVLNVMGYVGESTAREVMYAHNQGKAIRLLNSHYNIIAHCKKILEGTTIYHA